MRIRDDIARLLHEGHSNTAIARQLHVDRTTVRRTRTAIGLPPSNHGYPQGLSLEDTWQTRTQPVDGGHLQWTGAHNACGVPGLTYHGTWHSARAIAFTLRTGRDPVGYVKAECDHPDCVAPGCVDDEQGRQRTRAAMRAVLGMPPRPTTCPAGHDQTVHGRLDSRSVHYCAACNHTATNASAARRNAA